MDSSRVRSNFVLFHAMGGGIIIYNCNNILCACYTSASIIILSCKYVPNTHMQNWHSTYAAVTKGSLCIVLGRPWKEG